MNVTSLRSTMAVLAGGLLLGACSSGGDEGFGGAGNGWTAGVYLPSGTFHARCVAPRSGIDPATGQPYPDVQGTVTDENNFLRSYSDETYLWYGEIIDRNPAQFTTPAYFAQLRTTATTASGTPKDQFHFTFPTDEWFQLSQSGVSAGYGAAWVLLATTPPREAAVAYTQPDSPATAPAVNLARGARILAVDGVDLVNDNTPAGVDTLNAGLFPAGAGEQHTFTVLDLGAQNPRDVTMTSANITSTPVQNVGTLATATGNVGYMLFNDHIATAEEGLVDAVNQLAAAGISDLVLDIRYNGGGFLDIASELSYMIAGDAQTAGRTFEELQFNDKHPSTNPVTGQPLVPVPFHDTTLGFSIAAGQPLPALNLPRVFVLSGPNTCSASESVINSLRGVDVEVIQIGSRSCGKPYGFYPTDNCGTTYFTIQFRGVNEQGFGDYSDGFAPQNTAGVLGERLPGCSVGDDFAHALGDPLEARLAAALNYRETQGCPAASGLGYVPAGAAGKPGTAAYAAAEGVMPKSPWRENRIMDR